MKVWILTLLFLLVGCSFVSAQPTNPVARPCQVVAASTAQTDVQTAVSAAKDGQTVCVPAGSSSWSSTVSVTGNNLTIIGDGLTRTIITTSGFNITGSNDLVLGMTLPGVSYFTGTVRTAATCNLTDVQTQYNAAVDLDIIQIPNGTCSWTSFLDMRTSPKAVMIRGQNACTVDANGRATSCPTIIQDNGPDTNGQRGMFHLNLVSGKNTRIHDLEIDPGTRTVWNGDGTFQAYGIDTPDVRRLRLDHIFHNQPYAAFIGFDCVYGVIDRSTINIRNGNTAGVGYPKGSSCNNTIATPISGDGIWAENDNFGTDQYIYFEDDTITYMDGADHNNRTIFDSQSGGRYGVRHSTINQGSLEGHGLEATRERSTNQVEAYNNVFVSTVSPPVQNLVGYMRGGKMVFFNNTSSGYTTNAVISLLNNRSVDVVDPWGGSDGRSQWDVNGGTAFDTCTSATPVSTGVVRCAGKTWTTNQYQGYVVRKTGGPSAVACSSFVQLNGTITATCIGHGFSNGQTICAWGALQSAFDTCVAISNVTTNTFTWQSNYGANVSATASPALLAGTTHWFSLIQSNTSTDITFTAPLQGSELSFSSGDTFEINKVTNGMDQVGWGKGGNVAGSAVPTVPSGFNDQINTPAYEWNNANLDLASGTCTGNTDGNPSQATHGCILFSTAGGGGTFQYQIQSGRDYIDNGTTAKPGYSSYTYPHPLTTSTGP